MVFLTTLNQVARSLTSPTAVWGEDSDDGQTLAPLFPSWDCLVPAPLRSPPSPFGVERLVFSGNQITGFLGIMVPFLACEGGRSFLLVGPACPFLPPSRSGLSRCQGFLVFCQNLGTLAMLKREGFMSSLLSLMVVEELPLEFP